MSLTGMFTTGILILATAWCQPAPPELGDSARSEPDAATAHEDKRILGVIPNYRTASIPVPYRPLSTRAKFAMAEEDSFDRGTVILSALVAAQSEMSRSNPAFGQEWAGYGRYFAAAYADFAIGDNLTEGVFPWLFRQDPRYFRRGTGSTWSRLGYAVGQLFWVHGDNGRMQFNYSEVLGNAAAVAISTSYYSNNSASGALLKLGMQIGLDAGANVLKEFSSDINRKLTHRGNLDPPVPPSRNTGSDSR